jgi:hypothetical protein
MLVAMLEQQTFRDFELVYVDTYYEENKERVSRLSPSFRLKHVPVHPKHRYWYDQGYTYIAAAKNTGILYADGELCVTCDDAELFPLTLLHDYWQYYKAQGVLLHAFHKRMKNITSVRDGKIMYPITGEIYINDMRASGKEILYHVHGSWLCAGTSFPLAVGLALNGFNERMDGYKSLEDNDFGIRMAMYGCKFVIDKHAFVYILDHPHYDQPTVATKKIGYFIPYENYSMIRCAMELNEPVANKNELTDAHLAIIQRETLHYRQFDPLASDNRDKFEVWKKTPKFDLVAERAELRASSEWKW